MSRLIDLTNQQFGRLTVLHKDNERKTKSGSYWVCQCECGNTKSVKSSSLRRGEILSCGCLQKERATQAGLDKTISLVGQRFGKLTVVQRDLSRHGVYWSCACDCGKTITVQGANLKKTDGNQTISCGCHHRSIGALEVLSILEQSSIPYIEEYSFIGLPKSRFDFAIIQNNQIIRLIEFDGEQHFKDIPHWGGLDLQQKRDLVKNEFANKNNIPLVRIPYWERGKITLEMIMGNQYVIQ